MGVVRRLVAIGPMLGLVACAAIAGLESPTELEESTNLPPDRPTPDPTSSSGGPPPPQQTQDADSGVDASTPTDAAKDADAAPTVCTNKTPNGGVCTTADTCCNNRCNEAKQCASDCRSNGSSCNPVDPAPCCVGFFCYGALCAQCIQSGQTAADVPIVGGKNPKSCCSRQLNGNLCQ